MKFNLTKALLIPGAKRSDRNIRMPCPVHQPGKSIGDTLSVGLGDKGPVWQCFAGCDQLEVRDALICLGVLEYTNNRPPPMEFSCDNRWIHIAWKNSTLIGDPIYDYFNQRHIPVDIAIRAARGGKTLRQRITEEGVELLANISDNTGHMVGMHRTLISTRGLAIKRRSHGKIKGAAIRLFSPDPRTVTKDNRHRKRKQIAIAEGIETALSYRMFRKDEIVWSLISATGIVTFQPPPNIDHVIVAADFDGTGIAAYEKFTHRNRGRVTTALGLPPEYGNDWNDCLRELATKTEEQRQETDQDGLTGAA